MDRNGLWPDKIRPHAGTISINFIERVLSLFVADETASQLLQRAVMADQNERDLSSERADEQENITAGPRGEKETTS